MVETISWSKIRKC
jgi:hypothetical protein